MDGVDDKEKHSDDIHDMEQRKDGPMIEPALKNDELKQYDYKNLEEAANAPLSKVDDTETELEHRASLGKRAWNFIHQHRPELNRELNKGNGATPGEKHDRHRGTVTNPETDMRLKENKEKEEKEQYSRQEEAQNNLTESDQNKKQKMIEQLDKLNKEVRKAAHNPNQPYPVKPGMENHFVEHGFDTHAPKPSKPGSDPTKPWVPKDNMPTGEVNSTVKTKFDKNQPVSENNRPHKLSQVAWTGIRPESVVAPKSPNAPKPSGSSIALTPGSGPISGSIKDHSAPFVDHPNPEFAAHARALGGPGQWDKDRASAVQKKMSQHPVFGPMTPPAPKATNIKPPVAAPAAKPVTPYPVTPKVANEIISLEKELRNNVRVGSMVSGILGNKPANIAKLTEIKEKLHKAMNNEQDLNAKNDILTGISLTANLILNIGFTENAE